MYMVRFHFARLVFSILIRFNSPETPIHLDSPDTPFIGRRAFYPKPHENLNDDQGKNSNNSGATGNDSLRNDSTQKPSINKTQQRQRNQFHRYDKDYRQNGQRAQDRHQG